MEITEREIRQDFAITFPVFHFMTGIVIAMMLVVAIIVRDLEGWLLFLGVTAFVLIFGRVCMRGALRDLVQSGKGWRVSDAGLERVYPSGKAETIRWGQVRQMKWVRFVGLIIRWEESKAEHQERNAGFKSEFRWDRIYRQYRGILRVQEEEAKSLMAIGERRTGATFPVRGGSG